MIDVTELRLGNIVSKSGKSYSIDAYDFQLMLNETYRKCINPIPLDESWLLKSGFENIPHATVMNSKILQLGRNRHLSIGCVGTPNEAMFICDMKGNDIVDLICIHNFDYDGRLYLHRLQNIVYYLTNTDLTIKI